MTVSGGNIDLQGMSRSIRVVGEVKNIEQIKDIVINTSSGAQVKLKDIAIVRDGFKEAENFARYNGKNVVTLNVIKKSGQNLIDAADQIDVIIKDMQKNKLPSNLIIEVTGDQSKLTRNTVKELNNTIIIGFILVTIVLMFFMGLVNAIVCCFLGTAFNGYCIYLPPMDRIYNEHACYVLIHLCTWNCG